MKSLFLLSILIASTPLTSEEVPDLKSNEFPVAHQSATDLCSIMFNRGDFVAALQKAGYVGKQMPQIDWSDKKAALIVEMRDPHVNVKNFYPATNRVRVRISVEIDASRSADPHLTVVQIDPGTSTIAQCDIVTARSGIATNRSLESTPGTAPDNQSSFRTIVVRGSGGSITVLTVPLEPTITSPDQSSGISGQQVDTVIEQLQKTHPETTITPEDIKKAKRQAGISPQ